MATLRAHFDGRVLIPDEPVDLPVGCALEIQVRALTSAQATKPPLQELADVVGTLPQSDELPADGAAQHDHYLYGMPKKP